MIGDDAFLLREWMMKPFSICYMTDEERIFNYLLSQTRCVVENAFGTLANCFRCPLSTLHLSPEKAKHLVLATVVLHNIMRT